MSKAVNRLRLSDWMVLLRAELANAILQEEERRAAVEKLPAARRSALPPSFSLEEVSVEVSVTTEKSATIKGTSGSALTMWVSVGGEAARKESNSQRLTLKLKPVRDDGAHTLLGSGKPSF